MIWLLTTLAFGWGLHDVDHFCNHPPKVTESWIGTTYDDMEGAATTHPERWFADADSVSLFESWSFNTIGVVVRAPEVSTALRRTIKQLEKHYVFNPDDEGFKTWTLRSNRKFPEFVILLSDDQDDILVLATCAN